MYFVWEHLCPCSTQNQNQCFLYIKKTKLQDILEFLVLHIIIEAGFSVVTHLTVHVVVWKQSDKHTQPRLTLRVPSLSFYQNWSLLIFKNYSKIWMHAFLTTFFIQIMPLHFFVLKVGVAQCTKSQIFCSKSLLFSHANFKTIVEKTTQRLLKTKLIEVKKYFEIGEKSWEFFEQNFTFWFTVQPFFNEKWSIILTLLPATITPLNLLHT